MRTEEIDKLFSFWYPVGVGEQLGLFEGVSAEVDILKAGHIVFVASGNLLCKGDKEKIMKADKASKEKKVAKRIENSEVCPDCLAEYKRRLNLFRRKPRKSASMVYTTIVGG